MMLQVHPLPEHLVHRHRTGDRGIQRTDLPRLGMAIRASQRADQRPDAHILAAHDKGKGNSKIAVIKPSGLRRRPDRKPRSPGP